MTTKEKIIQILRQPKFASQKPFCDVKIANLFADLILRLVKQEIVKEIEKIKVKEEEQAEGYVEFNKHWNNKLELLIQTLNK